MPVLSVHLGAQGVREPLSVALKAVRDALTTDELDVLQCLQLVAGVEDIDLATKL